MAKVHRELPWVFTSVTLGPPPAPATSELSCFCVLCPGLNERERMETPQRRHHQHCWGAKTIQVRQAGHKQQQLKVLSEVQNMSFSTQLKFNL